MGKDTRFKEYTADKVEETPAAEEIVNEVVFEEAPPAPPPKPILRLNIGSGTRPVSGFMNIDMRADVSADQVVDVRKGLPFADNEVDEIRAHDFLEHLTPDEVIPFMKEAWRVLRPNGLFDITVPTTEGGMGAFQDPYHRSFWNMNSFLYYTDRQWNDLYPELPTFVKVESGYDRNDTWQLVHVWIKMRAVKAI